MGNGMATSSRRSGTPRNDKIDGCGAACVVVTLASVRQAVAALKEYRRRVKAVQKSTVGGILSIVAGALGAVGGLILLMVALFASAIFNDPSVFGDFETMDGQFLTIMAVFYGLSGVFMIAIAALGIVGGVFAIQRKRWGWALAGAIAGCLSFLPMGVGAVVLVAMARSEFSQNASGAPPQTPGNIIA